MKNIFLLIVLMLSLTVTTNAQLADGSISPDFTVTDINGNQHRLYDYLDQGYSVVLHIFGAWVGPSWSYHNSENLQYLYTFHGPAGFPGVGSSTTDDVMVLMIETDSSNTLAQLQGVSNGNQSCCYSSGDFITGTPFPIIDDATILDTYQISYYPTIYLICQNRVIRHIGAASTASIYTDLQDCEVATYPNDPALLNYIGESAICTTTPLTVRLQNVGTSNLTSATIKAFKQATEVASFNWTGDLATYDYEDVEIGEYSPETMSNQLVLKITSLNDDITNDTIKKSFVIPANNNTPVVTVKMTTDAFGSETTWDIKNSSGQIIASGGPFNDLIEAGETVQPPVTINLPGDGCYSFSVYDASDNGICCGSGVGYFSVHDGNNIAIIPNSFNYYSGTYNRKIVVDSGAACYYQLQYQDIPTTFAGLASNAGNFNLDVLSNTNCDWDVVGTIPNWLTVSPNSGTGSGIINFTYEANTADTGRHCVLNIAGINYHISQMEDSCTAIISVDTTFLGPLADTVIVQLFFADQDCYWNLITRSNCDWVHIDPMWGNGNTTVTIITDPNPDNQIRSCELDFGGTPFIVTQDAATSVSETTTGKLELYPNPANDVVNIALPQLNGIYTLSVYTAAGQLVSKNRLENVSNQQLSTSHLTNGFYLVVVEGNNGIIGRKRLAIAR